MLLHIICTDLPQAVFSMCTLMLFVGTLEAVAFGYSNLTKLCWAGQDVSADVRQSAFALVGDLAKVAASHFAPSIGDLLALGIANLQPAMLRQESMSACNNACWSLGGRPSHLCQWPTLKY